MSKYLCTFPGKYGDILWSLPTAKYIAERIVSSPVDFAVMPYYESLLPLIKEQSYIDRAYVIPEWLRTHSNYGDQPWQIPAIINVNEPYERIWNLGYRCHPGLPFGNPDISLMDFIAYQQGITFSETMIPFLTAKDPEERDEPFDKCLNIAMAFNEQYAEQKEEFKKAYITAMHGTDDIATVYLDAFSWSEAASELKDAVCFVGDRSANWVIANGLGKQCITFEPHPSRHASGHLGKVFGCPGGKEFALPFNMPAAVAGQTAAAMVKKLVEERTMVAR
jgi:hypothetical protein